MREIVLELLELDDRCLSACETFHGENCMECLIGQRIHQLIQTIPLEVENLQPLSVALEEEGCRMAEVIKLSKYREKKLTVFVTSLLTDVYHTREDCPRLTRSNYKVKLTLEDLRKYSPDVRPCKTCSKN